MKRDARLSGNVVLILIKKEGGMARYRDSQGFVGYMGFMAWSQLPAVSVCPSCGGRGSLPNYDSETSRVTPCGDCDGKGYKS